MGLVAGRSQQVKKFKKIYVEITNRCNRACSFCQPTSRPGAFMRAEAFAEILEKIRNSTDHISLHVLGEALLHPDLEGFLAASHRCLLRVNLSTNGVLLRRNQQMLLEQRSLRQVNISLHSFEQTGRDSVLNSYLAEILEFIDAAVAFSPLIINLRMWNQQQEAAPDRAEMNSKILRRLEKHFSLPTPVPEDFSSGRGLVLAPRVYLSRERCFAWPHAPAPDGGEQGSCRGLRDHIAILVDGTVVPCCLDAEGDIALGNIFYASLQEILASPRAVLIREGFARQRVVDPLCRRCTYRKRFQRENGPRRMAPG